MFTFLWSMPNCVISAFKWKMSAHCIAGYKIWEACWTSASFLPIICPHLIILCIVVFLATLTTFFQYSASETASLVHRNSILSVSIPQAFQTSTWYLPTSLIFSKSPPILLLSQPNQSATHILNLQPALSILLTFIARIMPWAIWRLPEGSKPS